MQPSLEYFAYIANTLNITRAAEELHITQQGLSRYLKHLENYFGTPLFTRKPVFALTPFGEKIYRQALRIQKIYEEIDVLKKQELDPYRIRIGLSTILPPNVSSMLPLQEYSDTHSEVMHYFAYDRSTVLFDKLFSGELDILISMFEAPPEKEQEVLKAAIAGTRSYILIHPHLVREHYEDAYDEKLREWADGIDIENFFDIQMIVLSPYIKIFLSDMENSASSISIDIESEDPNMALELCNQGMGALYLPWEPAKDSGSELLCFPVRSPASLQTDTVKAYTTESNLQKPYFRDFWNMLL